MKKLLLVLSLMYAGSAWSQTYTYPEQTVFFDNSLLVKPEYRNFNYFPKFNLIGFSDSGACAYIQWGSSEYKNYFQLVIKDLVSNKVLWQWIIVDETWDYTEGEEFSYHNSLRTCKEYWKVNQQMFEEKLLEYKIQKMDLPMNRLPIIYAGDSLELTYALPPEEQRFNERFTSFSLSLEDRLISRLDNIYWCDTGTVTLEGYYQYKNFHLILVMYSSGSSHNCYGVEERFETATFGTVLEKEIAGR